MGQNPAIEMLNLKSGFHSIYQVQQIRNKGEIVSFLDQRIDTFRIPVAGIYPPGENGGSGMMKA